MTMTNLWTQFITWTLLHETSIAQLFAVVESNFAFYTMNDLLTYLHMMIYIL